MYVHLFLALMLMVSVVLDLMYKRIPNWLILIGLCIAGLILYCEHKDWYYFCFDAVLIFLITYILYVVGALGGGDVKLFIVLALIIGYTDTFNILLLSLFIGAIISIFKIIYEVFEKNLSLESFQNMYIHFSIPISIATIYIHFLGGPIIWNNLYWYTQRIIHSQVI